MMAASDVDQAAIHGVATALLAAVNASDVDGILACWAADGVLLPPHHDAVRGADAIAAYFRGIFAARRLTFAFLESAVSVFGDAAVERVSYASVAVPIAGGPQARDVGKGLHVYTRRPDGTWELTQDIWNSDLPADAGRPSAGHDSRRLTTVPRMKNLFDPQAAAEVKGRLRNLRPESARQWGRMNVAQAVAHCARALELALGEHRPPRMLIGRLIGRIVKPLALGNDEPMRRNSPTVPGVEVTDERDLLAERERLERLIDRFVAAGPSGCTTHPHSFFGRLTPDEWAVLMYKHLDHHLRQFAA